jgi:membrane protease YdiL (CAAX protease family)
MAVGVIFAASSGKIGPVIFAGVLALGLILIWFSVRRAKQHIRAIYSSAVLFGLVHSGVWPSPMPLFVLGLGLGWIAVQSRGLLVPIIVHGLFNAVSAVYVLRGAA